MDTLIQIHSRLVSYLTHTFRIFLLVACILGLAACGGDSGGEDKPETDGDNDSVVDSLDTCVNTPTELITGVNAQGCHADELNDGDSDTVMDAYDMCLSTPSALTGAVNSEGCHSDEITDTDGDSVFNSVDMCINTPSALASAVNIDGCHADELGDADSDGVVNTIDLCPSTASTLIGAVDVDGCHSDEITDGDSDGVMNAVDVCVSTPVALAVGVGVDGCHSDETTDSDADGVMNSVDMCLATPSDLAADVGGDGCHLDESTDTDNDGIMDSLDACPGTSDGVEVDDTGCDDGKYLLSVKGINVGYLEYMTQDGVFFERDRGFTWSVEARGAITRSGNQITEVRDVKGTEEDELFRAHRMLNTQNNIHYTIPLDNRDYRVRLYFSEMNGAIRAGGRQFDVTVEGDVIFENIDIYGAVGAAETAYILLSDDVSVTDGSLNLGFVSKVAGPMVSAIEVLEYLDREGDEDGDTVLNIDDECVHTPDTFTANINSETGCAPEELDTDNDGVLDPADSCPLTPNLTGFPATDNSVDSVGCSLADLDNDSDGVGDDLDQCDNTAMGASVNAKGCSTAELAMLDQPFVEENGLLVVELESTNYPSGWRLETGGFATGNAFLEWHGGWNPNPAGVAENVISIDVEISTPGVYRLLWRNGIGHDVRPSEANDSWVKVTSENTPLNFFGFSSLDKDSTICPPTQDVNNQCVQTGHRENNAGGSYFKVFRNQRPTFEWSWTSFVNGADTHAVYAEFLTAGIYQVVIEGRSANHGLDRLVLYRDDTKNDDAPSVTKAQAEDITIPESARAPL